MRASELIVPPKHIEYGLGYIIIRSPYTPWFFLLKGDYRVLGSGVSKTRARAERVEGHDVVQSLGIT